jgi:hypothetical protein
VLLTGLYFPQCSKYCVLCVNVCVIHFQVTFADFVNVVEVFKCPLKINITNRASCMHLGTRPSLDILSLNFKYLQRH